MRLIICLLLFSALHAGQVQTLLGDEMWKILNAPDLVYYKKCRKKLLTRKQVTDLKNLLLNDENYFFEHKKKCLFLPEETIVFEKEETVTLTISLSCYQVEFSHLGKRVVLDIDPANETLREVFE